MGATLFFYPAEWTGVAARLRERIRGGAPAGTAVKVGLGANNNKVRGRGEEERG
jgi:hypothetical protein